MSRDFAYLPPNPGLARGGAHREPSNRPGRLDASMSLLQEVTDQPLDPGYALAARRRAVAGETAAASPTGRGSRAGTALLAIILGLGTAAAVQHLRAPVQGTRTVTSVLRNEIDQKSAAITRLQTTNERLRAEISRAQAALLASNGGSDLTARLQVLGLVAGELPVTGPGIELALDDAPTTTSGADGSGQQTDRVMDTDLQIVVNGLWAAGAEAISINDQRLTVRSAIRSAGKAIMVDFRPLAPPYLIRALGNPSQLQSGLAGDVAGAYLQSLRDSYRITATITAHGDLHLPGASGEILRYARVATTRGKAPPSGGHGPSRTVLDTRGSTPSTTAPAGGEAGSAATGGSSPPATSSVPAVSTPTSEVSP